LTKDVPPLKRISMQGYRAAHDLEFEPASVCALVGEASSGKSTVLTGIWSLLEAAAPPQPSSAHMLAVVRALRESGALEALEAEALTTPSDEGKPERQS